VRYSNLNSATMDFTKEQYNRNPREKANPLSVLFFTYTIGMFKKGYSKALDVDDLYSPIKSDRSTVLGDRLERQWDKQMEKIKKSKKTQIAESSKSIDSNVLARIPRLRYNFSRNGFISTTNSTYDAWKASGSFPTK
jgi:hypothetical protein